MHSEGDLLVGELARLAGVSVQTVRYYERRGLLVAAPRDRGGYRRYSRDTLEVLTFIKKAQALGFSLGEISVSIGESARDGACSCDAIARVARAKIAQIDREIEARSRHRTAIAELIEECAKLEQRQSCAVVPIAMARRRSTILTRRFSDEHRL